MTNPTTELRFVLAPMLLRRGLAIGVLLCLGACTFEAADGRTDASRREVSRDAFSYPPGLEPPNSVSYRRP